MFLLYASLVYSEFLIPPAVLPLLESLDKMGKDSNLEIYLLNFQINMILVLVYLKAVEYGVQSERVHMASHF